MNLLRPQHNDIRCSVCLHEFKLQDFLQQKQRDCPNCHTLIPPMSIAHDGYIKLNWQDARVLAIYSRRWITMFDTNVQGNREAITALNHILDKLRMHRPKDAAPLVPENDIVVVGKISEDAPAPQMEMVKPALSLEEWFQKNKDDKGNVLSPFFKKTEL